MHNHYDCAFFNVKDGLHMKKEEFYYLSTNGKTKIHGICYLPDEKPYTKIIQLVHGKIVRAHV